MAKKIRAYIATWWDEHGNAAICLDQPKEGGVSWTDQSLQDHPNKEAGFDGVMENLTPEQFALIQQSANGKVIFYEEYDPETNEITLTTRAEKMTAKKFGDLKKALKDTKKITLGDETKLSENFTPEELLKLLREEFKVQGETKYMEEKIAKGEEVIIKGKIN